MLKTFKHLKTIKKELIILLFTSLITYFLIEVVLMKFSEIFSGAYELGQFFSKISISYISAFIFYFIVIHIKSEKDKENINEWVGYKAHSIITDAHLFIQPLMQVDNKNARFKKLTKEELHLLLKSIKRRDKQAPYIVKDQKITWLEWFEKQKKSTQESIKEIFVRYPHLDSEFIKIITRIENSIFFYQWDLLYYTLPFDETFAIYEPQIQTYLQLIEELENYSEVNFKKNKYRISEFIGYK